MQKDTQADRLPWSSSPAKGEDRARQLPPCGPRQGPWRRDQDLGEEIPQKGSQTKWSTDQEGQHIMGGSQTRGPHIMGGPQTREVHK